MPAYADVLEYLVSRGFTIETLEKYRVGAGSETFISENGNEISVHVIYFPMYQMHKKDIKKLDDLKMKINKNTANENKTESLEV